MAQVSCSNCDGSGGVSEFTEEHPMGPPEQVICTVCGGSGKVTVDD